MIFGVVMTSILRMPPLASSAGKKLPYAMAWLACPRRRRPAGTCFTPRSATFRSLHYANCDGAGRRRCRGRSGQEAAERPRTCARWIPPAGAVIAFCMNSTSNGVTGLEVGQLILCILGFILGLAGVVTLTPFVAVLGALIVLAGLGLFGLQQALGD